MPQMKLHMPQITLPVPHIGLRVPRVNGHWAHMTPRSSRPTSPLPWPLPPHDTLGGLPEKLRSARCQGCSTRTAYVPVSPLYGYTLYHRIV